MGSSNVSFFKQIRVTRLHIPNHFIFVDTILNRIKYILYVLILETPIKMRLVGYDQQKEQIKSLLTLTDKKVEYDIKRMLDNRWLAEKLGPEEFKRQLKELQLKKKRCLLFEDEVGMWTYSGLRPIFEKEFEEKSVTRNYKLPEPKLIPWDHTPQYKDRYYQTASVDAFINAAEFGPAAIEVGTGLGKSTIARNLIKELALKTIVMAPSVNIASQLYDDLLYHFGKSKVGFYGNGKHQADKLITVGIAASLTRLEPEDEEYQELSKSQIFIIDESHLSPAATLAKVCFGLVANAPYRFSMSGTQLRTDGLDLLLQAITGPIVYEMPVIDGVDQGFLAKPIFKECWINSNVKDRNGNLYYHSDVNKMTKAHAFYNEDLNKAAAEIANKSIGLMSRPVVILIDELEQFTHLLPYLRYEVKFAHGGVTKANKEDIPEKYHSSDPKALVNDFNAGKFPILVGTSCIGIGTDIKAVKTIINLRQGKSYVEISQNVGRGTRLFPGKEDFIYIDIGVKNVEILEKHARARMEIFKSIYPNLTEVQL